MTTRITLAILVTLSLGGCVREGFRPVATARTLGADVLGCDDVRVFESPSSSWGRDPLLASTGTVYRAEGCGQRAHFVCSEGARHRGQCSELPVGPYRSPAAAEPHAALITEVRSTAPAPAGLRELLLVEGDGWIFRRSETSAPAIPIRAGALELGFGAEPMRIETEQHTRLRSRSVYGGTVYYTERYTTRHLVSSAGCTRSVRLNARPGMTYRLTLDLQGPNHCQVHCAQETIVNGRLVRSTCEGFDAS